MSARSAITLAGISTPVGRVGYGLMMLTMCAPKDKPTDEQAFTAMKTALDAGSNYWSTGSFYGPPTDPKANLKLLNRFFTKYPECMDKVVLNLKGGLNVATREPKSEIGFVRDDIKACQEALGAKKIDVFEFARVPQDAPIETVVKTLQTLQSEGLFTGIALTEASAATLTKVASLTKVVSLELEISPWSLEADIVEAIAAAEKAHVPVLAYSPLGRGFLTRKFKSASEIPDGDPRKNYPRFQPGVFDKNLELVDKLDKIADKKGKTTAEICLAFVMSLGSSIIPIPGSTNPARIKSNIAAAEITLTPGEIAEIRDIIKSTQLTGGRYGEAFQKFLMG